MMTTGASHPMKDVHSVRLLQYLELAKILCASSDLFFVNRILTSAGEYCELSSLMITLTMFDTQLDPNSSLII